MEHLLYICNNYSAKIWVLAGRVLTLALSRHTGEGIPAIILTPLEIVFNKHHLSLLLHLQDSKMRKVIVLLLQEVKQDIVFQLVFRRT
jgi:hypothetical protein